MIALALRLSVLPARYRRGTGWDDDIRHRIGLVTNDRLVYRLAVIRTVWRHGSDFAFNLLEQRRDLTSIVSGLVGQNAGDDFASDLPAEEWTAGYAALRSACSGVR
jgi:hypothetical protein